VTKRLRRVACIAAALFVPLIGTDARGQSGPSQPAADFEVYVPKQYDRARRWPILFVLDPRGRATLALDLFKPAAERLGYIVMSSRRSLSDSNDPDVNVRAFNTMLDAAQTDYSIDLRRLYIAGFSGTARAAVSFAVELRGRVAGVVAAGAAPTGGEFTFARDSAFAYFAAAGETDFNHDEVVAATERMRGAKVPYRLDFFPGPHAWPPADVCGGALEWFTLRAMRGGLIPADTSWIASHLDAELATAEAREKSGRWADAARLYAGIARDYAPSNRSAIAQNAAAAIARRPQYGAWLRRTSELMERDLRQSRELPEILKWFRSERKVPSADALADRLKIDELRRESTQGDSLAAPAATRIIARTLAVLSFYEPRSMLDAGDYARARTVLEVAARIAPLRGESCALLNELNRRDPPRDARQPAASCS
jgi:predicted esterase